MKICAVICEYNPFHNGHAYQLGEIRRLSGCDRIVCLMSGNFTQRGDAAVFSKFTRARHAVENGADAVLELPAAFAVSPAELFARGAVRLLASVPSVQTLAFGCESGEKEDFLRTARATLREDGKFKAALKENMKDGTSYVRARTQALLSLNADLDEATLSSPNNMLGVEYCRSILAEGANIEPLPILRVGQSDTDPELKKNFSSATALRAVMGQDSIKVRRALKSNLPPTVYADALSFSKIPYETAALCALLAAPCERIAKTPDCSEGLENRIRAMLRANPTYEGFLEKVVSKRYTRSRVKRIVAQTLLGVTLKDVRDYLGSPLYLRTLALKRGDEALLAALSESKFPLIVRKSDSFLLKKEALACFERDTFANALYDVLSGTHTGDFETLFL